MPAYTEKVDALLVRAVELGFTEQDFADLCMAAADQAGVTVGEHRTLGEMIVFMFKMAHDRKCHRCGESIGDRHEDDPRSHACPAVDRDMKPE